MVEAGARSEAKLVVLVAAVALVVLDVVAVT